MPPAVPDAAAYMPNASGVARPPDSNEIAPRAATPTSAPMPAPLTALLLKETVSVLGSSA